jgi:hypothetical protein
VTQSVTSNSLAPVEVEAGGLGEVRVDVGVADVHVASGPRSGRARREVVLAADEVDVDAVRLPELRLVAARAVGARPDHVAELRHRLHQRDRDRPGGLPNSIVPSMSKLTTIISRHRGSRREYGKRHGE